MQTKSKASRVRLLADYARVNTCLNGQAVADGAREDDPVWEQVPQCQDGSVSAS